MTEPQNLQGVLWSIPVDVEPNLSLQHPRVFYTPRNLAVLQTNLAQADWARTAAQKHLSTANSLIWAGLSDEQITNLVPAPHSYFMYGYRNVCPDGSAMKVSWEHPGHVVGEDGALYPNEAHPDNGRGWTDTNGRTYYFVGRWNGFVIEEMTKALEPLTYAYLLSGEQCYAHVVAVMLDALASIYPYAIEGPLDYPGLRPGYEGGRLERPYYQVARHLIHYVNAADLIWNSGELDVVSPTNPSTTMKENIAYNLLLNGGDYCYRQASGPVFSKALNNGAADYNRGALAVGSFLGIKQYVAWAIEGPNSIHNMIANNIDRDGNYYETSTNYTEHTRALYLTVAEMLFNLRTSTYPTGVNLFKDQRFESFYVGSRQKNIIAGHLPAYGDTSPDRKVGVAIDFDEVSFEQMVRFYARAESNTKREEPLLSLAEATDNPLQTHLGSMWQLCNLQPDVLAETPAHKHQRQQLAEVLGGKGMAFLRSGEQRGVFLRYGPTLNHGQHDEMSILIYANGREHSFDPGYGVTPYGLGFQRQTLAHLAVVVNEKIQLTPESAGGSLNFFTASPGLSIVDASDEAAYIGESVDMYRRCVALIDTSDTDSYVVDIFRVAGGHTRDYSFHAIGDTFTCTGLALTPPMAGSLAGSEYVWGDKVHHDSSIVGFETKPYQWVPEPGNGYGFLTGVQKGSGEGTWSAEWQTQGAKTRLLMLPTPGREIHVANGPTLMGVKYLLARDLGSNPSQFVSVIDPVASEYQVAALTPLTVKAGDSAAVEGDSEVAAKAQAEATVEAPIVANHSNLQPVAFKVNLDEALGKAKPRYDIVLSTLAGQPFTATDAGDAGTNYTTDAEFTLVRYSASGIEALHMVKGTTLSVGELTLSCQQAELSGQVETVDYNTGIVLISCAHDLPDSLVGTHVYFNAPEYSHNSPYRIESLARIGSHYQLCLNPNALALACGKLNGDPTETQLPNIVTLPYALNVVKKGPNRYFDGKLVIGMSGARAVVEKVLTGYAQLEVDSTTGFEDGDTFTIYDIKAGDTFQIPLMVHLTKNANGNYMLDSPVPVQVSLAKVGQTDYIEPGAEPFTLALS